MLQPEASPAAGRSEDGSARRSAVLRALDDVLDPELDEPVTDMGFVETVAIADGAVTVTFRLPTFWCSANFAFLMAVDMRHAVERLPWVAQADIRLVDHFAARKINQGVAAGQSFSQVFAGEAATDLDEIRQLFRQRAFLGRQERLLRLLANRWGAPAALAVTVGDLRALTTHDDAEIRALALRYLAVRLHDGGPADDRRPAFVTLAGEPVDAAAYPSHLRNLRKVRGTAEANAELCRIYLEARTRHPAPGCGVEDRDPDES